MKSRLLLFLLLLATQLIVSQDYNGKFISDETSYKDEINPENNFVEQTRNYIIVQIEGNEGGVICQDPRIPDKVLAYRITEEVDALGDLMFIFRNCVNEHLGDGSTSTLTFYKDEAGDLNLMISTENDSQVFNDLVRQE